MEHVDNNKYICNFSVLADLWNILYLYVECHFDLFTS